MPKHYFNRLEYLDALIQRKNTGTPEQLAGKLTVSKRTVFEYIDILKDLGAEIQYNSQRKSYYYVQHGAFSFRFKEMDVNER